ncbi:hypothetical protein QBC45DRAFT_79767 [Copromyces sp. CBS 386.78]|nr:hypothetical protein QBC45DRAFT_79767 [Copromyces sp. CBS 386.78]
MPCGSHSLLQSLICQPATILSGWLVLLCLLALLLSAVGDMAKRIRPSVTLEVPSRRLISDGQGEEYRHLGHSNLRRWIFFSLFIRCTESILLSRYLLFLFVITILNQLSEIARCLAFAFVFSLQ